VLSLHPLLQLLYHQQAHLNPQWLLCRPEQKQERWERASVTPRY
jgi:hypothetical protein